MRFFWVLALCAGVCAGQTNTVDGTGAGAGKAKEGTGAGSGVTTIGGWPIAVCGWPLYGCGSTSLLPITYPAAPNVGGISGSGRTFTDPVFGTKGVRITDGNFDPSLSGNANNSFVVSNGGSSDNNWWSTDSKLTLVSNSGGFKYLVGLDPATLQVTRPYSGLTSGCPRGTGNCSTYGGWSTAGSDDIEFSEMNPCKIYYYPTTLVQSYEFGSDVVPFSNSCSGAISGPPTVTTVTNFIEDSPPGCSGAACNVLPSDFGTPTWSGEASTVAGDVLFGSGFSSAAYHYGASTGQGSGCYVAVWSPTKGGMAYNTCTGAITGDTGWSGGSGLSCNASTCSGTASGATYTIHNAKFGLDGSRMYIQFTTCITGTCISNNPFVWIVGTTTVYGSEDSYRTSGHWCAGYSGLVNGPGNPSGGWYYRTSPANGTPGAATQFNTLPEDGIVTNLDAHCGWQMDNADDNAPMLFTTTTYSLGNRGLLPYDQPTDPWWNEIDFADTNGDGLTHREALTFNSGYSNLFNAQNNITSASQKCVSVGSDWFNIRNAGGTSSSCIPKGPKWHASYAYASGYTITPASAHNAGAYSYEISGACASGATEPGTWNQTIAGTQSDGTCTWTNIGVPSGVNACGVDVYAWCFTDPPPADAFQMFVVERSAISDPNFPFEAPFLAAYGGVSVACPWTLDEGSNVSNTASAGYTWNLTGDLTGCGGIVKNYLSVANGGLCTANCPKISMSFYPIQSPAANGNTFTPTYVFSSNWATASGAAGPQDAVECDTAGGRYLGDSSFLNTVANVNTKPITNIATGLPVTSELPYMKAWENYIAAAKPHYATLLGNQLGYMRFGSLGPNEELHDFCSAQLIAATGVGDLSGLKTLWMNTLSAYKAFETAVPPITVPLQTLINKEQGGDASWMMAEAGIAAGFNEGIGFNGVNASDLTETTDWVVAFGAYPNVPHEVQTVTQSATDGSGTTGTLTAILPFVKAHVSSTAPTYYEPFTGDGACILVQGYTDENGCLGSGTYYAQYQSNLAGLFIP